MTRERSEAPANTIAVWPSRKRWALCGALFGLLSVIGVARGVTAGNEAGVGIVLLLFGGCSAFAVRMALRRRPLMVLDDNGFTDGRAGRTVRWDAVEEIVANTHQGIYGLDHSLRLVLRRAPDEPIKRHFITTNATNQEEIEVDLDGLALPREEIFRAIELKSGRPVLRTGDAGFQKVTRRRRQTDH